jgi:hypothetical protein
MGESLDFSLESVEFSTERFCVRMTVGSIKALGEER